MDENIVSSLGSADRNKQKTSIEAFCERSAKAFCEHSTFVKPV